MHRPFASPRLQYLGWVEQTSPNSVDFVEQLDVPESLLRELWLASTGATHELTCDEFGATLCRVGGRYNYGLPAGSAADEAQKAGFLKSLRLEDLALATACGLGRELAWLHFLNQYRAALTQAAVAIAGSATLGHDLADSLYSELYGLRAVDGERKSPLASYSGRGSLMGWLRTTLAQRFVDHHRRTRRETPLDAIDKIDAIDAATAQRDSLPSAAELTALTDAVTSTMQELAAEERFLLCCYFLDRQPLAAIGRTLGVHEATISRRIQRLLTRLRKRLLHYLQRQGLSKRAAEEALGNDPRDLELNLRTLLQSSQTTPFPEKTEKR